MFYNSCFLQSCVISRVIWLVESNDSRDLFAHKRLPSMGIIFTKSEAKISP